MRLFAKDASISVAEEVSKSRYFPSKLDVKASTTVPWRFVTIWKLFLVFHNINTSEFYFYSTASLLSKIFPKRLLSAIFWGQNFIVLVFTSVVYISFPFEQEYFILSKKKKRMKKRYNVIQVMSVGCNISNTIY